MSRHSLGAPLKSAAGIQLLASRSLDDALRAFEGVLVEKPTNLVALLGKVSFVPGLCGLRAEYCTGARLVHEATV